MSARASEVSPPPHPMLMGMWVGEGEEISNTSVVVLSSVSSRGGPSLPTVTRCSEEELEGGKASSLLG